MAILDYPDISPDSGMSLTLKSSTTVYSSELNNAIQTAALEGAQWAATLAYTNRTELEGRTMKAFLTRLNGRAGRFRLTPPDLNQLGTRLGTGLVDGAGQTGDTLNTKGWTINQTNLLEPGDYINFNGELKMVVETATSDGAGLSSIIIAPPIRKSTNDNDAIEVTDPQGIFMLTNDNQAGWDVQSNFIHGATVDLIEDVT